VYEQVFAFVNNDRLATLDAMPDRTGLDLVGSERGVLIDGATGC
jgi:hypothetical protein